jgi:uncharacterized membrane protein YoaK (UPF0700 family)
VAFFGLGVFTANMTGNTILFGGALAARFVPHVPGVATIELPAISILCFVLGSALAAFAQRAANARLRTTAPAALTALLLVAAALLFSLHQGARTAPCVALLSAVMGLQSVLALRAGVPGISTTYVTGTLVTATMALLGPAPRGEGRSALRRSAPHAATWALYLAGGIVGTAGLGLLGDRALWPPAVVVALLIPVL